MARARQRAYDRVVLSYPKRVQAFAVAAAALAGFVDAVAFIQSGGFFVSFMSGNSTRMAVGFVQNPGAAWTALALIAAFVVGVAAGSALNRWRAHGRLAVTVTVSALLFAAAYVSGAGLAFPAALLSALSMGALNMVLEENGETRVALTYMTGALVKIGQKASQALFGGPRWAWLPYVLLWLGLAGGAVIGALTFQALGAAALLIASALALVLGLMLRRATPSDR